MKITDKLTNKFEEKVFADFTPEQLTIWYWIPDSTKEYFNSFFIKAHIMEPPLPPLAEYIGEEARAYIAQKVFNITLKQYVEEIYYTCGVRGFKSPSDYTYFITKMSDLTEPIKTYHPGYYFTEYGGYEQKFFTLNMIRNLNKLIKNPEQYIENPEHLKKYLEYIEWKKFHLDTYHPEWNPSLTYHRYWQESIHYDLIYEVNLEHRKTLYQNQLYDLVSNGLKEIDLPIYLKDLEAANKIVIPEMDFSDSLTLSFSNLDFNKINFEFNIIKNFNILNFNPFEFFTKNIEIIYSFFINNIYLISGLGIFGFAIWVGLIIFIDKKYQVPVKK